MNKKLLAKTFANSFIFLLVGAAIFPSIHGNNNIINQTDSFVKEPVLDMDFIFSITENLSNMIFTEYNESFGELAKGRAFGSKGEHKAAQILYENMTKLGLESTKEQIQNIENPSIPSPIDKIMHPLSELTYAYEALDFELILTNDNIDLNESVDCQITPIIEDPESQLGDINTYSFNDLKVRHMPRNLRDYINAIKFDRTGKDYVFITKGGNSKVRARDPNADLPLDEEILRNIFYPIRSFIGIYSKNKAELKNKIFFENLQGCRGIILYDFIDDTFDTYSNTNGKKIPIININGSIGKKIISDIDNFNVSFFIKQRFNTSVVSYNVVGEYNPSNSDKAIIVCCLYDSVWCQGTADSAIGMAIVMGVAKYFTDNKIDSNYNIKFIGFGGEESGCRGARYYEATHRDEDILYVVDMNQVGFYQIDPKLTLNVIFNKFSFMNELWGIVEEIDYEKRVENTAYIAKRWWPEGVLSDQYVFNHLCPTVCFLKDFPWTRHHRDGLNHTEGDVMEYYYPIDAEATGEIVLNILEYLAKKS